MSDEPTPDDLEATADDLEATAEQVEDDLEADDLTSDDLEAIAQQLADEPDEVAPELADDALRADGPLTPDEIAALIAAEEERAAPPVPATRPRIEQVQLPELPPVLAPIGDVAGIDLLMDVPLQITVELGQATRTIRELLEIGQGSLLHLSRHAGEPVDVLVNGQPIAKGEVVVIDENFGIRVTEVVSPADRLRTMAA
jgi:flagellar motor switch protein FliN/FliY